MFDLTGQVALVTGSSRGIGYAAAQALGRQGATVILNGRQRATLEAAAARLKEERVSAHVLPFDIADPEAAAAAVTQARAELGRIDIFFSNAGVQHREPLLSYQQQDFDRVVFANLTSQWALAREVARGMSEHGYGRIIFTGSITALRGRRDITAYTAAKAAIHGLVRQWAVELAEAGVTVNAVAPGYIKTELTSRLWNDEAFNQWLFDRVPQKRWGDPQDIASAVVFLAAREAQFMTGQVMVVDGGMSSSM
ncbi:SDR family NAD(P)-dependent oxidoreductase [Allopusillimonas ginsengisoli]|uniref:SDR family NAD(P)-dependent oxidoreductase n=1 Tax=Allopusillimonas ginsengisoli TaxID=453575 RepID=UPI0010226C98|nr:glucose 1-dehydrogenase [Allopusillimonas ginsengisoli]TEA80259.1 glucose 1-dehydrogenase [Allopusillimonas ginsengisoli]